MPAIMSVGLVFTVAALLRDLLRRSSGRVRRRRTRLEAGSAVGMDKDAMKRLRTFVASHVEDFRL